MSNKKTHEEYVSEVAVNNPNVEVVDSYVNAKTKINHRCKKHNIVWSAFPESILHGCGCHECCKEKIGFANRTSLEKYLEILKDTMSHILLIGNYINMSTPVLHYCTTHNQYWTVRPDSVARGHGCKYCGYDKLREQKIKSHEQYVKEVRCFHPTIEVVGEYSGGNTEILHRCKVDGHMWMAKPGNILSGKGCAVCAGVKKRTTEEYINEIKLINPNICVLGDYIDANTPILHQCLIDGYLWMAYPSAILRGAGCHKCRGGVLKTHDEYVLDVARINPDIEVIGQYVNSKTPILHKCKIDGFVWPVAPSHVLSGQGCPQCQESSGEAQIRQWLMKHGIDYIYQYRFEDCRDKKELPFDFYLQQHNILIEYDGRQHFEPIDFAGKGEDWAVEQFKIIQYHDDLKNLYCQNCNIKLLRIPYFKNVEEELEKFLFI